MTTPINLWCLQTFQGTLSTIVFQTSTQPAFLKKTRKSMKDFLYGKDKPNVSLYGLSDLGREKVAIGLGDVCCRAEKEVLYITYNKFADIMRLHCGKPKPNKIYSSLLKS